jgi:DNA-binding LytR/AlgR family response regulator
MVAESLETRIRVLLVDDEYLALKLLKNFVQRLPDLEIIGQTKSPIEAVGILQNQPVDLLFLDIQMKSLDGIKLLRTVPNPPITIFTTAYSEYASTAFDLNAVDYLLKPFSFERFVQAINKAKYHLKSKDSEPSSTEEATVHPEGFITMKVDRSYQKIPLKDILIIEGLQEYIKIICDDGKNYITLESLKKMESFLPRKHFMRVHKSYIISKSKARQFKDNLVEIGNYKIPVSRSRKQEIIQEIFPR